jgi:hypothetical protein
MAEASSTFIFSIAFISGLLCLGALISGGAIFSKMFKLPNEKTIQINIDYRFIPMAMSFGVAFLLGSTTWYGIGKGFETSFLNQEGAEARGFIGRDLLIEQLAAKEEGKCDHVRRPDGKPVFVAINSEEDPSTICGVTHEYLQDKFMVPFVVVKNEHRLLLGSWPFDYSIAFTMNEENG